MSRPRVAFGFAAGALAAVASYAVQRLWASTGTEPSFAEIVGTVHITYYWRVGVAALHGVAVGALLGVGLDDAAASRWTGRIPGIVALLVPACAIAMVAVP